MSKRYQSTFPEHIVVAMPALSPTMEQGNVVQWKKAVGDEISAGDILCEIETDKAAIDFETMDDGFLATILCPDGTEDVPVGHPIAVMCEDKSDIDKFSDFKVEDAGDSLVAGATSGSNSDKPSADGPPAVPIPVAEGVVLGAKDKLEVVGEGLDLPSIPGMPADQVTAIFEAKDARDNTRIKASPKAKAFAASLGLTLNNIQGTGPDGRIVFADVQAFAAASLAKGTSTPSAIATGPTSSSTPVVSSEGYSPIAAAQEMADRLMWSKQNVPHYYLTVVCRVDALEQTLERLNLNLHSNGGTDADEHAANVNLNAFVLKASQLAMKKVPQVNGEWSDGHVRLYNETHVNVSVQTPHGVRTPVVHKVDTKGLAQIAQECKALESRGQDGNLSQTDLSMGTFTVMHLGQGLDEFVSIIQAPQACVLAVGGVHTEVRVKNPLGTTVQERYEEANVIKVTLSCDHRVVDGAVGSQWLQVFKGFIENPETMLL